MKRLLAIAAAVIFFVAILWFALRNESSNTPEHSLDLAAQAVAHHDVVAFSKVVDVRNLTNKAADDIRAYVDANPGLEMQSVLSAIGQYIGLDLTAVDELDPGQDLAERIEAAVRTGKTGTTDNQPAFRNFAIAYKGAISNTDGAVSLRLATPSTGNDQTTPTIQADLALEKLKSGWRIMEIANLPDLLPSITPLPSLDAVEAVRNVILSGVRQYYVENIKEGKIFVIEGIAENQGAAPVSHIRLRAVIFNQAESRMAEKTITANNVLGLYQLRVFDRAKLNQSLDKPDGPMSQTIAPGGQVKFMFIFYDVPESAAEFEVRVVAVNIAQS
ncbi:DUF3426 domain-containing protein [Desulfovibrio inopinatus]|uniref:DUF3426 domain-containing protein n=1 Tax=Desulfovibrio inopinatus TaxID=102109 RepID=UPI00146FC66A|nr:DUF3426 domain-containing protein [Desulfovibrio inopinatus]